MLMIDPIKAGAVNKLIDGLNEVILKMVNLIMLMAPFAVFALLAQIVVSSGSVEILQKLLFYGITSVNGIGYRDLHLSAGDLSLHRKITPLVYQRHCSGTVSGFLYQLQCRHTPRDNGKGDGTSGCGS